MVIIMIIKSSAVHDLGCEAFEGSPSSLSAAVEVNLGTAIRQEGSKEGKKEAEQGRDRGWGGGVQLGVTARAGRVGS